MLGGISIVLEKDRATWVYQMPTSRFCRSFEITCKGSGVSTGCYVDDLSADGNNLQGGLFFVCSTGSLPPTIGDKYTCHNKVLGNGVDLSA